MTDMHIHAGFFLFFLLIYYWFILYIRTKLRVFAGTVRAHVVTSLRSTIEPLSSYRPLTG